MTQIEDNPLLAPWTGPFGVPPFGAAKAEHYQPAFEQRIAEQLAAIEAIASSPAEPTFDNTVLALERSGLALTQLEQLFFNLTGTDSTDELQAVELAVAPILARHASAIYLDQGLYGRTATLHAKAGTLDLTAEQRRVLDRYHTIFVRAGAALDAPSRERLAEITERLAVLGTLFGQNVLADEQDFKLVLEEADLDGLPESLRSAAAQAADERGLPGKYVITLLRSSVEPFLQFSRRRDLRQKVFDAWIHRGETGGRTDNSAIIAEMVTLRAERARLLGFQSFAHFRLADTMAKTPEAAIDLLNSVWTPARARAGREQAELQKRATAEGQAAGIAAWDWRYYTEQVRREELAFDEGELKPYLPLDKMIEAAFYTAHRLFGLDFAERRDVPVYHPDVRVWDVTRDGKHVGLFLGDYFARPSKRSGAWMSAFRDQHRIDGDVRPIIVNVMNFSKAAEGQPPLLSFDDARTLFHEFGHALHGLLSNVTYPLIAGTNVARDFVELPSQLFEHWLEEPEVLRRFARHHETGEPIPEQLLGRVLAARTFNQGFQTVEYASSALVDLDLHLLPSADNVNVIDFERKALADIGMPEAIVMRHRTPHFGHIFSGEGYAAGYYSYLWSEVLDADGYNAFMEAGDPFDPETAKRLHDYVYSAGSLREPDEAYRAFRGRDPQPQALLQKRGLV